MLFLERPHWETRVWIDDRSVGARDSLSTPHQYDLGPLTPGPHRLTIRVDNRMIVDVGENAHSVSDHTQGNWNGIVGRMELRPRADDVDRIAAGLRLDRRRSASGSDRSGILPCSPRARFLRPFATPKARSLARGNSPSTSLEESPRRVETSSTRSCNSTCRSSWRKPRSCGASSRRRSTRPRRALRQRPGAPASRPNSAIRPSATFGFREIKAEGTQFVVNGRKTFIRGTLECCIFPKTGHPPTDVAAWKQLIGVAKSHGLNCLRFHSWCPPEAAFVAADELGMYFQVEVAAWAEIGLGKPIDKWLYAETDRILQAYGNHPSFVLMPYGNEPSGKDREYLADWVAHYREQDPRRLYTSAVGLAADRTRTSFT